MSCWLALISNRFTLTVRSCLETYINMKSVGTRTTSDKEPGEISTAANKYPLTNTASESYCAGRSMFTGLSCIADKLELLEVAHLLADCDYDFVLVRQRSGPHGD